MKKILLIAAVALCTVACCCKKADKGEAKIVFLADEAHHLNSETKRKLNKSEEEDKENWESIMKKAFKSHDDNLMLEFTATLPNERSVL